MITHPLIIRNGAAADIAALPVMPLEEMRAAVARSIADGSRALVFCVLGGGGGARLFAALGAPASGGAALLCAPVGRSYPAFTPDIPQLHLFEREIFEQSGVEPLGHPWLKPVRFSAAGAAPGVTEHFRMSGDAAHEVAVGPVHAGVIEPGHFRFQCLGENVAHLEISLGYQHRGVEEMLAGGPRADTPHIVETAAGDSSIAAAWCCAALCGALGGAPAPSAAELRLRAVMLELERLANHAGDLGALSGDVAFLPSMAYCGRLRGEFLNMTAEICGNRFGRGAVAPGGARARLCSATAAKLRAWLLHVKPELDDALGLMLDAPSVLDRFEGAGVLSVADARALGVVGVAARASGLALDARVDFPLPGAPTPAPPAKRKLCGDVLARALVRRDEIESSTAFLLGALADVEGGAAPVAESAPCHAPPPPAARPLAPERVALAVVESWRGEMAHMAFTDAEGKFARYKIVDPSFHNWFGLAMALRGEQISNFPVCNKSFNLSYCGCDL